MEEKFENNYDYLVRISERINALLGNLYEQSKDNPELMDVLKEVAEIGISVYEIRKSFAQDYCPDEKMKEICTNNTQAQLDGLTKELENTKSRAL